MHQKIKNTKSKKSTIKIHHKSKIDTILRKLLSATAIDEKTRKIQFSRKLEKDDLFYICEQAEKIFLAEPVLLELAAPLKCVGDVHGQYEDVLRIFKSSGFPPLQNYLFLGDYVDRGVQSIETISILFALKVKYPKNVFLLRGNHESSSVNRNYGFLKECLKNFDIFVWRRFVQVFNCMPVCALIERKIFCTHGGLSPKLKSFEDILKIRRPTKVPSDGLLSDLLWSDPSRSEAGWRRNMRGTSYTFGQDVIEEQVRKLGIEMVVRAHQLMWEGHDFQGLRFLATVFSAPNYIENFDNKGAIMNVDENLRINFILLLPRKTT